MASLSEYFQSLANKMRSKTGKSTTMTPNDMITEVDAVYQAGVESVPAPVTQTKTVTAGTAATTVTPDSGKLLSEVTVNPTPSQTKTAPAIPNGISYANGATIAPDSGKLLSSVTIPKPFGGDVANSLTKKQTITSSTTSTATFTFPETGIYIFTCATSNKTMPIAQVGSGCSPLFIQSLNHTATSGTVTSTPRFYVIKISSLTNAYIKISSAGAGTSEYIMCKIAEL